MTWGAFWTIFALVFVVNFIVRLRAGAPAGRAHQDRGDEYRALSFDDDPVTGVLYEDVARYSRSRDPVNGTSLLFDDGHASGVPPHHEDPLYGSQLDGDPTLLEPLNFVDD